MKNLILIFTLISLVSCTTTSVITNSKHAQVFVDGQYEGKGSVVEIPSWGSRATVEIKAKENGQSNVMRVTRKFTFSTLVVSLFTYGLGLLFYWQLPDTIVMPRPASINIDPWNPMSGTDPWLAQ
ncbi:MAG: hypothetical protein HYW48_10925 [Deltaproteobacteria bacterium]|nr:hypothetical protein [Deltaproteobacteria bacterium]